MDVNGGNILVVGANGQLGQCFKKLNVEKKWNC